MSNRHYAYIDALRGYAILAVIATHTSQMAPAWQGIGRKFVDQGARGVELFFLASALTLMMSWHARNDGVINFYIRRIFRIAPMFWLGIILYTYLHGFTPQYWSPDGIDVSTILATALFAHGWYPAYFNSVVPGGWSIAVEMSFYLVFPLLAYYFKNSRRALWGAIFSLVVAYLSFKYVFEYRQLIWPAITHDYLTWNLVNLWFPNELPVFMTGILLYFVLVNASTSYSVNKARILLVLSVSIMVLIALKNDPYTILRGYLSLYAAYGLVFGVFAFALAKGAGGLLVNSGIEFFGRISFSAYIWHFAVLELLGGPISQFILGPLGISERGGIFFMFCFPLIVLATTLLSFFSYTYIEKPMISMGNRLICMMKRLRASN